MAEYILDVMSQTSKLDWAFPFQRTGAFPIDRSAVFSSLADAQNYALGVNEGEEAKDERKLGGTSYVGQIISVYEAAEEDGVATANAYIITPARGLLKLAATTTSGDVSADIAALQGQVSAILSDIETLEGLVADKADASDMTEALALKADTTYVNEELAKKAVASEVTESLALKADKTYIDEELAKKAVASEMTDALALKANAADVYVKNDVYTKSEVETYVNGQIGSAGHLKREIVEALPAVEEADADTIYMLKKVGGLVDQDHYEEYMVINGAWELIGDTYVDLTNYATKSYVDGEIDTVEGAIALKADQSALDTANENIAKKADTETVNAALDLKADKTQVATDISNAVAPLAIKTEVEDALALKADKSAHEELVQTVSDNKDAVDEALLAKADTTYVNEELVKKADKATTLAGYGITDAYTKEEVNAELLLKASQQDHNALVDVVNSKANAADVYTKGEADEKFAEKASTLAGYGITDAYTSKQVDDLIAQLSGDNSESAASVLAQLNTYKNENDARVDNVEDRVKALEEADDDNIIETVKVAGTALTVTDKAVDIPAATAEAYGVVKLSAEVGVNDAGALEVKALNVNKLSQTEGDWLILNGGTAAV